MILCFLAYLVAWNWFALGEDPKWSGPKRQPIVKVPWCGSMESWITHQTYHDLPGSTQIRAERLNDLKKETLDSTEMVLLRCFSFSWHVETWQCQSLWSGSLGFDDNSGGCFACRAWESSKKINMSGIDMFFLRYLEPSQVTTHSEERHNP